MPFKLFHTVQMCGLGESLELFGPWFLYFENKENDNVISETLSCSSRWSYLSLCNYFLRDQSKKETPLTVLHCFYVSSLACS